MAALELKFLGTPLVLAQNRPLKFATRKSLALLAYLVLERGVHPRGNLVALFYPESEPRLAYPGLRNTLARLRETLQDQTDALLLERDSIGLNFSMPHTLDLDRVNAAVTAVQAGTAAQESNRALLQNATRAARGPFLDGLSLPDAPEFDNWTAMQSEAWQRRLDLIYDNLSLQQLQTQQLGPAIETVARWINQNRLNENAYRRLMRLHFLNDDRAAALQTFEICRTLLAQELNAEPTPRTLELFAQIRSHKPKTVTPAVTAEHRPSLVLPLVGRVQDHQELAGLYATVALGQTQVVAIVGESGMGKTRLAAEFVTRVVIEGADVLEGRAYETGEHLPFHPLIDALRDRLERENAPEDLLDDVWLVELARLLPELHERYPDLPRVAHDETTARSRLFEALARLGLALAARRPLVWLVDDIQWADPDTFEILHYLARRWNENRAPVMLVLVLRQEAVINDARLREWLAILAREVACTHLTLKPLPLEDLDMLVQALRRPQNSPDNVVAGGAEFAQWLFTETQGQPFFVQETLANLDENGTLVWQIQENGARTLDTQASLTKIRAGGEFLAPAIRDVIRARLARISRGAFALMGAAAVVGRNCAFARLCRVTGMEEVAALDALDELLAVRLLSESPDDPRPYTIAHERIRQVVYGNLGKARQTVYHHRELDALVTELAPAGEIAFHALAAGEWQAAFQHSLQAAKDAMDLYAVKLAIYHFETSRRLLQEQKISTDRTTRLALALNLGSAYEIVFQQLDAVGVYQELYEYAVTNGDRDLELAALVGSGTMRANPFDAHDFALAIQLAEQALPLARMLGDSQSEAQIENNLAIAYVADDRRVARAMPHIENSARLARAAGAVEPLALTLMTLGGFRLGQGEIEGAAEAWQEALDIFRRQGNRSRIQDAIHVFGMIRLGTGEFDRAFSFLDQAYTANQALGSPTEIVALATTRSTIHIIRGAYERAFQEYDLVRNVDETLIASQMRICMRQQLAWLHYDLGEYEVAAAQCQRALDYRDGGQTSFQMPTLTLLTLVQIARGELENAAETVARGVVLFDREANLYPEWWEALPFPLAQGEFALAVGDLTLASDCAEYLVRKFAQLRMRHLFPAVLSLRARVALAQGNPFAALQDLEDAVRECNTIGAHRELWRICLVLAKVNAQLGNAPGEQEWQAKAWAESEFLLTGLTTPDWKAAFDARSHTI